MIFKRKKPVDKVTPKFVGVYESNRRDAERDRRTFGLPTEFPFVDSEKKIIQQDRRSRPERRINNIVVKETSFKVASNF